MFWNYYQAIFDTGGEVEFHDIREISNKSFRKLRGKIDCICGGLPCQSVFTERVHIIQDYYYTISTKQTRVPNAGFINLTNGKYRYLTERECFRLMGFTDLDFDLLRTVYPEKTKKKSSILYQQAGNSIVVSVLEAIVKQIYQKELIK
ncbi:DNA cytosine methyltransferase [Streptococcus suis]|uniref:DNA cytosine methyltransferase n=1 Tax=Streptococcus suis TaxID=1307 RepID=UPI002283F72F